MSYQRIDGKYEADLEEIEIDGDWPQTALSPLVTDARNGIALYQSPGKTGASWTMQVLNNVFSVETSTGAGLGHGTAISFNPTTGVTTIPGTLVTSGGTLDFAEGDWTPTVLFEGGNPESLVYAAAGQKGRYVKTGKQVTVSFNLLFDYGATAEGTTQYGLAETSLPYTVDYTNGATFYALLNKQNSQLALSAIADYPGPYTIQGHLGPVPTAFALFSANDLIEVCTTGGTDQSIVGTVTYMTDE